MPIIEPESEVLINIMQILGKIDPAINNNLLINLLHSKNF